jgi:tudor domain-containing protein 1/4/6/7
VPKTNVKALDPRFKFSALILKVVLPYTLLDGVSETEVIKELTQQTANYVMTLTLIEPYRDIWWIGNISYKGVGVDQILNENKKIRKINIQEVKIEIDSLVVGRANISESIEIITKESQNSNQMQSNATLESSFDMDKLQTGVLCHVDDPENFYICLKQDIEAVEELTTNLQIVAPSLPTLDIIEVGSLCIAKYSVHDKWYRAKIIGCEPDMITLYYIDHGFIDCLLDLDLARNLLKVHQEMSPRAEGFAINCGLVVKSLFKEWPDNACAVLREFLHKEVFFEDISILGEAPPQKHLIKIYCNQENMADHLVALGVAVAYRPILSFRDCFVSHINSLSEFYIQMDDDSNHLEILASYLMDAESDISEFPELQTIQLDTSCIARFNEDNLWYRAKVMAENEDGTVNVFFLDYGNTCSCLSKSQLRKLKPDFDCVPPFAMKCSLQIPDNILQWSDAAEQKFRELADEGSTTFKVQLNKTYDWNSPNIVALLMNEINIVDQLQDLCDKCVVTFERAVNSFENNAANANMCAFKGPVITTVYHSPINLYLQYHASTELLSEISKYTSSLYLDKFENREIISRYLRIKRLIDFTQFQFEQSRFDVLKLLSCIAH